MGSFIRYVSLAYLGSPDSWIDYRAGGVKCIGARSINIQIRSILISVADKKSCMVSSGKSIAKGDDAGIWFNSGVKITALILRLS